MTILTLMDDRNDAHTKAIFHVSILAFIGANGKDDGVTHTHTHILHFNGHFSR